MFRRSATFQAAAGDAARAAKRTRAAPPPRREDREAAPAICVEIADAPTNMGLIHDNALGVESDVVAAATRWPRAALLGTMAWLTRARVAPSRFSDRFFWAARYGCTAGGHSEAERATRLPLDGTEGA